ncbi:MAG: murein biosynthesis integral membrane protein MurJ [Candidatus Protistobacter heckmanni]|nr:murein biosynthesis integral membrane protein MurJ [Candidatus Protistobacter heckmanni]
MNLLKALVTISGLTLLSRITGLVRETLIARAFGSSELTDAFNVAFRIPNLLRRLFAEGAFSQAFVPILGEFHASRGEAETRELIAAVATVLVLSLLAVCLLGVIGAPVFVGLIATGFLDAGAPGGGKTFTDAVWMTRLMFPYIGLISLVAMASGVLNTWKKFALPAFTPTLLNLSFIAAALWLAPHMDTPVYALAWGVLVGGVAQFAIQLPALTRIGMLPAISFNLPRAWRHPGVRRVLLQMVPATLAVSVSQLSLIINTNIASHLLAGSVSWLGYADRLMEFPTALLGVALGTILLPSLSKTHAEGNAAGYSAMLDWGLRLTLLLAVPSAAALFLFGAPLTATLFNYGRFGAIDVEMTRQALMAYGVGLTGLILVKILAPGFYAKKDIRTPVKIGVIVMIFTQLCNLAVVPFFQHAGLALSIGLGACLNALLLFLGLRKRGIYKPEPGWARFLLGMAVAVIAMGLLLHWLNGRLDWVALGQHPWERIGWLTVCVSAAAAVYFMTLKCVGLDFAVFCKKMA